VLSFPSLLSLSLPILSSTAGTFLTLDYFSPTAAPTVARPDCVSHDHDSLVHRIQTLDKVEIRIRIRIAGICIVAAGMLIVVAAATVMFDVKIVVQCRFNVVHGNVPVHQRLLALSDQLQCGPGSDRR
jgi:hypothetical protein